MNPTDLPALPQRSWLKPGLGLLVVAGLSGAVARIFGAHTLAFAVLLQVLLMRWALALLAATRPALQGDWFRVRPWEAPMYRWTGVPLYRGLLRLSGWERFRRAALGFDGTRGSLSALDRASREAEYSHLLLALICAALMVGAAAAGAADTLRWLLLTTVFFHVYPVLLQRSLRARLQKLGGPAGSPPAAPRGTSSG